WRKEQALLINAVATATVPPGICSSADARYARSIKIVPFQNELGVGRQLIALCRDSKQQLDFEIRLSLYDNRETLAIETLCHNVSQKPLNLPTLHPVEAVLADDGGLFWLGAKALLTNGQMYYDAGKVKELKAGEKSKSWWNIALSAGETRDGLVVGYLENKSARGMISTKPGKLAGESQDALELTVESQYERDFILPPGASVSSDRVAFHMAANPFLALESYAQSIGDLHKVRLNPPINGWCSWFSFFGAISEAEVIRNSVFAAEHLKPFGFEYIQVDDGFYRGFGDWEGNDRFPHGMKWLAETIRKHGLKPGIWLAPYVIAEGTEVHRDHPDWLVHHPDGRLKQIGPGLVEGSPEAAQQHPKLYSLDITHPGAAQWLHSLFKTVAQDWGYDFIKIDFVEWSLLAADRFYDPTVTKATAYRRGIEIMRKAMGPDRHLLDCGPGNVSVGLIDSMRIELDQPPVTWQQYFLHSASSAPAAAKRYYFHKRTWINDDDHVVLANLTPTQAQAAASVVSLSGGNMISGDRMADLDPIRLDILRKAFPSYGEAARPIDLFQSDKPEMFALQVKKPFGQWLVLGLFNAEQKSSATKTVSMESLGLDPAKTYVAFDFWNQKFFGEQRGEFSVKLAAASCLVLAIHERTGKPQLIGTDRHISQGGVELESVTWADATGMLRGVSLGARGVDHNVFIYLPEKHPWQQTDPFLFYDFPGYTLKITEENILRVHVRFDQGNRVNWELNVKKFFG
ncbi:MAG: alpha-galactosidase, partial [Limisphaerales bacterium]